MAAQTQSAVKHIAPGDLVPYEANPRHNDHAVDEMAHLIETWGFRVPVLKRGSEIVDGHLRVKAALKLGLKKVPAMDVGDLSPERVRALRISVNRAADLAEWDEAALARELSDLLGDSLSADDVGFDDAYVSDLMKALEVDTKSAIPDEPEPAKAPVPKSQDADAGNPANPKYVEVTFHMTAENRKAVRARLQALVDAGEYASASDALVAVVLA